MSPAGTSKETSRRARTGPKLRVRPRIRTAGASAGPVPAGGVVECGSHQSSTATSARFSRVTNWAPVSTPLISVPSVRKSCSTLTAW